MEWISCVSRKKKKKKLGLDWITGKDLGLVGVTGSIVTPCLPVSLTCDQQRTPFHHGWFPLPAGACCSSHIKELKEGWTFTCLITSKQDINSTTWMNQPHQHIHFNRIFEQWKLDTHKYHHTSTPFMTQTHRAGQPQMSSVLFFMLSLLKKKHFWWNLCCD